MSQPSPHLSTVPSSSSPRLGCSSSSHTYLGWRWGASQSPTRFLLSTSRAGVLAENAKVSTRQTACATPSPIPCSDHTIEIDARSQKGINGSN